VRVAGALEAPAAAYVQFDTRAQLCTMTCWPLTVDVLRLKVLVEHLPRAFPLLVPRIVREGVPSCVSASADPVQWRGSVADLLLWEVLGCHEVAQVPLHVSESQLRLMVLARGEDFSKQEMLFLCIAQRPLAALDNVLQALDPSRADQADEPPGLARPTGNRGLTQREVEVLTMLAEGMLARTIAARMKVSPRTVHKHLSNVYHKLEAHDRLLAVHRAEAMGLIPRQREGTRQLVLPLASSGQTP